MVNLMFVVSWWSLQGRRMVQHWSLEMRGRLMVDGFGRVVRNRCLMVSWSFMVSWSLMMLLLHWSLDVCRLMRGCCFVVSLLGGMVDGCLSLVMAGGRRVVRLVMTLGAVVRDRVGHVVGLVGLVRLRRLVLRLLVVRVLDFSHLGVSLLHVMCDVGFLDVVRLGSLVVLHRRLVVGRSGRVVRRCGGRLVRCLVMGLRGDMMCRVVHCRCVVPEQLGVN